VQLLNTVRRVEQLRQQFKDSAGNIAGHHYQRFASAYLAREDKRGSSKLGRLLAERLQPTEAMLTDEIRGLLSKVIGTFQRETCHSCGS